MNIEYYIAKRMLGIKEKNLLSAPIINIAVIGVAIGVCVMLLSIYIITGFKNEISEKLSGFVAHIDVKSYTSYASNQNDALHLDSTLIGAINRHKDIKQAYPYIDKAAILKNKDEIHGIIFKGVDSSYNAEFYSKYLVEGQIPSYDNINISNEILISNKIASLLHIKLGDKIQAHFVQNPPRVRIFTVKGIYDSGFNEYDDVNVLCDIQHLRKLNSWDKNKASGLAIEIKDIEKVYETENFIYETLLEKDKGDFLNIETIFQKAPQIYDWLKLLDINIALVITLIIIVSGFNMISGLLVLILDKTRMIGLLKALGYKNKKLRELFIYIALGLVTKGIIWGNLLALIIYFIQDTFNIIKLDSSVYYMSSVPMQFNLYSTLLLNVGVIFATFIMLIIPTILISKIQPIKAIQFD